jgi:hypothetical protein
MAAASCSHPMQINSILNTFDPIDVKRTSELMSTPLSQSTFKNYISGQRLIRKRTYSIPLTYSKSTFVILFHRIVTLAREVNNGGVLNRRLHSLFWSRYEYRLHYFRSSISVEIHQNVRIFMQVET